MKTIIIKILIILSILTAFWTVQNTYAEEKNTVEVTEKIPWAHCIKNKNWRYDCRVERWFWAIMDIMWQMLKFFTYLAWLFAVLSLVGWWIAYSMWWANENMKNSAKDYIEKSLIWLVLLLLSWTILYMVAPWIYV
jgi:hypothetical protein